MQESKKIENGNTDYSNIIRSTNVSDFSSSLHEKAKLGLEV